MTGLPPGEWSGLLVGRQWPNLMSLEVLKVADDNRREYEQLFNSYGTTLGGIESRDLATQEGATAEKIRLMFNQGRRRAFRLAEANRTKHQSYGVAEQSLNTLFDDLYNIASRGNFDINRVQVAQCPIEAKISQIVTIISRANAEADSKVAQCEGAIYSAIQAVLDAVGIDSSARIFESNERPNLAAPSAAFDDLTQQVSDKLGKLETSPPRPENVDTPFVISRTLDSVASGNGLTSNSVADLIVPTGGPPLRESGRTATVVNSGAQPVLGNRAFDPDGALRGATSAIDSGNYSGIGGKAGSDLSAAQLPAVHAYMNGSPAAISSQHANPLRMPDGPAGAISSSVPSVDPHASTTPIPAHASHLSPNSLPSPGDLAENFNTGAQAGGPFSAAAEAISAAANTQVHSQPLVHAPFTEAPTPVSPAVETAHASGPTPVAQSTAPLHEMTPTLVAPAPAVSPIPPVPISANPIPVTSPAPPACSHTARTSGQTPPPCPSHHRSPRPAQHPYPVPAQRDIPEVRRWSANHQRASQALPAPPR